MSWFTDLFTGSAKGLVTGLGETIDRFVTTDAERAAAKLEIEKVITERLAQTEVTARAELDAKQKIIVAELQHGDSYTKRARPTIIYGGLVIIAFNYSIAPLFGLPESQLPVEFWAAWGGVVGLYSFGRSVEKKGSENRLTSLLTGSRNKSITED